MSIFRTIAFFLTLIAASVSAGQQPAAPAPGSRQVVAPAGAFSAERLARLDRVLQQYVDEDRAAGIVALVLRDGKPVYDRAFGWSDKEAGHRMTTDTIFRIASQSKALTSVAVLSLMEEGALSLNTPVSAFIKSFAKTSVVVKKDGDVATVAARRPITIRDLLTHTAGISYGTDATVAALYEPKGLGPAAGWGWYTADKDEPVCDTMERLGTLPFVAQPGEAFVYGYNTDILGCVVERASGMPLDRFIASRITGPLGMKDTHFFLPPGQRARLAAVYGNGPDGKIARAPEGSRGQGHYVDGPRKSFAGGAGLLSTAHDYARFLEMIRRGGELDGVRILSPRTVALMTTNQVGDLYRTPGLGFGLGFETTERYGASGMASVGAFGWGGAYGTTYKVDPQARLVLVMMVQLLPNTTDIGQKFPNLVYQALMEPVE
ncbi:MAG TPA: serine hydrolase domain-containing protein [Vicinamibacterales bacterium]|nr:beta-lactamase family protein [Acidobacteriota bacterium]HOC17534.1 serine hydrolase domain-containing protein [Vicinamibacterales bacterium]